MTRKFELLEWDSNFFGFKVAKIGKDFLIERPYDLLWSLYKENVELVYYTSTIPASEELLTNDWYSIQLVSERVPILKEMTNKTEIHEKISSFQGSEPTEDLVTLALLAGRKGRFGNDPNISEETYKALFKEWITNSVKRIVADDVLVYRSGNRIVGFATIKVEGSTGYAPLLAVSREFEGTGVSFALMRAIETRLIENNCKYVMSGTQAINRKALATFQRYGLEPQPPEFVYHLWKK